MVQSRLKREAGRNPRDYHVHKNNDKIGNLDILKLHERAAELKTGVKEWKGVDKIDRLHFIQKKKAEPSVAKNLERIMAFSSKRITHGAVVHHDMPVIEFRGHFRNLDVQETGDFSSLAWSLEQYNKTCDDANEAWEKRYLALQSKRVFEAQ